LSGKRNHQDHREEERSTEKRHLEAPFLVQDFGLEIAVMYFASFRTPIQEENENDCIMGRFANLTWGGSPIRRITNLPHIELQRMADYRATRLFRRVIYFRIAPGSTTTLLPLMEAPLGTVRVTVVRESPRQRGNPHAIKGLHLLPASTIGT
jgi:hypothetical protein